MRGFVNWKTLLAVTISFLMVACTESDNANTAETLRIATVPDQKNKKNNITYQKLIDHIAAQTGIRTERVNAESYEALLHLFRTKQIDLALFGGVTYVKAHIKSNAVPLVMRDVDGFFRSVALVHVSNPANDLNDLKKTSIAFGARLSTSGHYMPRYFFQQQNIIPETYFSAVKYSGAHDLTAEWVRDGKIDVGLVNSGVVNDMFLDGRLSSDEIKVIWISPPYNDYVWAVQPDIRKHTKTLIRDSFLHLNHDGGHKELLKDLGANFFIPASHGDFKNLQQIILQMEQGKLVP